MYRAANAPKEPICQSVDETRCVMLVLLLPFWRRESLYYTEILVLYCLLNILILLVCGSLHISSGGTLHLNGRRVSFVKRVCANTTRNTVSSIVSSDNYGNIHLNASEVYIDGEPIVCSKSITISSLWFAYFQLKKIETLF